MGLNARQAEVLTSTFVLFISFSNKLNILLSNPALRQARNRCAAICRHMSAHRSSDCIRWMHAIRRTSTDLQNSVTQILSQVKNLTELRKSDERYLLFYKKMSDKIKFLSKITFRQYLEIIKHLTFKSVKIIWHICWLSGFFFIAYTSYKEYLEKPEDLNIILKSQLITSIILLLYPVYQFYQYYRNYHSKNSIFKEILKIEISNENILAYNDFYSKEISLKKIDKIVKIKDFVLIYFYQDFIILNLQSLEKSAKEKILNILNKKN